MVKSPESQNSIPDVLVEVAQAPKALSLKSSPKKATACRLYSRESALCLSPLRCCHPTLLSGLPYKHLRQIDRTQTHSKCVTTNSDIRRWTNWSWSKFVKLPRWVLMWNWCVFEELVFVYVSRKCSIGSTESIFSWVMIISSWNTITLREWSYSRNSLVGVFDRSRNSSV